jgi:sugar phosphate permease
MISDRLASALKARNIHYGWVVAGVGFLVMLATSGAMGAAGILILPLQEEFGWTNAEISTALALRLILFGLIGPFAAAFMNRFGIRLVATAALILIAGGVVGSIFMRELWQLVALWGIVVGVGTGLTAVVFGATVATLWFEKRRGLVVGLMTANNAAGQLIFLPILAGFAEAIGWRAAMISVVIAISVVFVLVLAFMRDRPSDLGLAPFGAPAVVTRPPVSKKLIELLYAPLRTLRDASKTHVFWALFLTFFVCGLSTNGLIQQHWIAICGDYGISPVGAAGLLAVVGVFDFAGTIISGWLSDRYDNRWLLFWFYGLRGLSLLYLPWSGFSLFLLAPFAVFYGLDWVATVPPTVKLAGQHFGPEKAGMVFGWVFTGHQLGAATAAFLAGVTRTSLDSYMPFISAVGVFCLLAAALILTIQRRDKPRLAPQPA